ncbi:hypothetical protein KJ632_02170 [Patescibacteria group bacterium]|nr:hypothetical protein [Patescibacteria group bacterium]
MFNKFYEKLGWPKEPTKFTGEQLGKGAENKVYNEHNFRGEETGDVLKKRLVVWLVARCASNHKRNSSTNCRTTGYQLHSHHYRL